MLDNIYTNKSYVITFVRHEVKDKLSPEKVENVVYKYRLDPPSEKDNFARSLQSAILKSGPYLFEEESPNEDVSSPNVESESDQDNKTANIVEYSPNEEPSSSSAEDESNPNNETAIIEEGFKVRLVVHSHKDFSIGQVSLAEDVAIFAQDFFSTPSKNQSEKESENSKYLPIIHLTLDDSYVDCLYSERNVELPLHISRSYQILDSSIWNKIVPYSASKKYEMGGVAGLYKAIQEIDLNYQRGLYNLEVAHEYANLNARLAKQAFLSGSHASGVSPFIFHSESAIKFLINRELCKKEETPGYKNMSITDKIAEHKWRLLLVDDKASEELTSKEKVKIERKDGLRWNCKLAIIIDLLKSHFINKPDFYVSYRDVNIIQANDNERNGILIEYAETVGAAEKALRRKKYDLILLDYLLDKGGSTEYGYELLNLIYANIHESNSKEKYENVPGPHGRFFFIFISAYTTAVYERLLAEGLNRSEKFWHIAVGACPTNTPNLFLYNLLKLMEKQLVDSGVDKLSAKSIYDVVNRIFMKPNEVRSRANKYYQDVLDMHYYYKKMIKDVSFPSDGDIFNTEGSVLISDFIKRNVDLGGLLEHLTQLVHLTAFGTIRQWPEMWEEYIYFKAQFDLQQFNDCFDDNKIAAKKFNQLCEDIESYILKLKSDMK